MSPADPTVQPRNVLAAGNTSPTSPIGINTDNLLSLYDQPSHYDDWLALGHLWFYFTGTEAKQTSER